MNVLTFNDGIVEFMGFDGLDNDAEITVRIHANKLIINRGEIQTETGKLKVQLSNKKSSDHNLCDLFRHYCAGKPTTFISSKADKSEYIQHLPVE